MIGPDLVFFFALSFLISVVLTWLSIRIANRFAIHALPDYRSSHEVPTPRIGGIAVAAIPLALLCYYAVSLRGTTPHESFLIIRLRIVLVGGALFFLIGLADDTDWSVRVTALDPLAKVAPVAARPRLQAVLQHAPLTFREEAAEIKKAREDGPEESDPFAEEPNQ